MKIIYALENDDLDFIKRGAPADPGCGGCPYNDSCGFTFSCEKGGCAESKARDSWYTELNRRKLCKVYEEYQEILAAKDKVRAAKLEVERLTEKFNKKYGIEENNA